MGRARPQQKECTRILSKSVCFARPAPQVAEPTNKKKLLTPSGGEQNVFKDPIAAARSNRVWDFRIWGLGFRHPGFDSRQQLGLVFGPFVPEKFSNYDYDEPDDQR